MKNRFKKIFVQKEVLDNPRTKNILSQFPDTKIEMIEGIFNPDEMFDKFSQPYSVSKKYLYLAAHQNRFLQNCPGMNKSYRCCNYLTIDIATNCDLDCTYCVLQSFFKTSVLTIYMNLDVLFDELDLFLSQNESKIFRIGTGEYTDSLSLDSITGYSKELISFFSKKKNALLELKTKTNEIAHLEGLDHQRNTVVSWSLNGPQSSRKEEFKTATIEERIRAAKKCQEWGYPVAFHFDPLLLTHNWEEDYLETFQILKKYQLNDIAWISIGTLRLTPGLKNMIESRINNTDLLDGELFPAHDGKLRYLRPVRIKMYQFIQKQILGTWSEQIPYYLCMETPDVWKESFGWVSTSDEILSGYLTQNLQLKQSICFDKSHY